MSVSSHSSRSVTTPPRGIAESALRTPLREVPPWQRWGLVILGLLLLHCTQRFSWPGTPHSPLWFPSAGLGLVLIAWFGIRGVLIFWLDLVLAAALQLGFSSHDLPAGAGWQGFGGALLEGVIQSVALWTGWALYHSVARGSRVLADPRSVVVFLLLVPGLVMGVFAALRVWLCPALQEEHGPVLHELGSWWIGQALGLVALAPPLLCGLTPWLIRRGLLRFGETQTAKGTPARATLLQVPLPHRFGPPSLTVAEWVEIAILAFCTGAITMLLIGFQQRPWPGGWQVWGVPLLLIVWAGLRQGMRAATLAIAVATILPLEFLPGLTSPVAFQGNLLAHCAALLVASSVSWMRFSEARYRQVAAQIPVVLYSARILPVTAAAKGPLPAEVTFVSPPSLKVLGATPAALLGDYAQWLERVHNDDREIVAAAVLQLERNNQPVTCEYRLAPPPPEGERTPIPPRERWLRETLVPHLDHEGQLEGWEGMVLDISEQRALADDLRRTTNMFHALVGNLPAGVFFVQAPHGQPILVNARARQLLGQRENASLNYKHFVEYYRLHRPDGTPYPLEELPVTIALRHGASCMREDIVVHRLDGRRVPLVTWAAPIQMGLAAKSDAAVWVLEDLTALRQAEAARRESEIRLRGIIDALAEGVLVQDPGGILLDCNAAAGRILGQPLEGLVGQALPDLMQRFVHEDGTPMLPEEHPSRTVLKTRRPVRNLMLGYHRAGTREQSELRWVLINALPLILVSGTPPAGVVTSLVDLTDLVQAQTRVRQSEEQYRGLVESLPLMMLQLDPDLKVLASNPATHTGTGLSEAELRQRHIEEVFVPVVEDGTPTDLFAQAQTGRTVRGECRYRRKDGHERVGYLIVQPHHEPTTPPRLTALTLLVVDMTRERRLAHELQRAQRLELVGRLSSGIAHDFNNLLTVILNLTDMVQETLGAGHVAHEDLDRIADVGKQASNLAQQLLDFSKQRKVPLRQVEITRVIRRTVDVVRTLMPPGIRFDCALPDHGVVLHGDEMQLQQVLMNLCLNARDAMASGGRLHVRVEQLSDVAAREWVRLSVHDSGSGMSEETYRRIFDPFFTTKELGAGLGLAVVKQIVDSFGGRIEVFSEPGLGSRFEVWLPTPIVTSYTI